MNYFNLQSVALQCLSQDYYWGCAIVGQLSSFSSSNISRKLLISWMGFCGRCDASGRRVDPDDSPINGKYGCCDLNFMVGFCPYDDPRRRFWDKELKK